MSKYYIGIDWGRSKCGMALADEENKIAVGYTTVPNGEILAAIKAVNKENPVKKIIIGWLEEGENVQAIDNFKKLLENEGFEVEKENEDFSSGMAQANLKETGRKKISSADDTEAARIILQSWLDNKK